MGQNQVLTSDLIIMREDRKPEELLEDMLAEAKGFKLEWEVNELDTVSDWYEKKLNDREALMVWKCYYGKNSEHTEWTSAIWNEDRSMNQYMKKYPTLKEALERTEDERG